MVGSPLDSWVGLNVVVVITESKITHGVLMSNHQEGITVQLADGRKEFIPRFIRVELRQ
jgi:hypothetical protein